MIANEEIEAILDRYPKPQRQHLIPMLQKVQDRFGYLPREALLAIGRRLHLPVSRIQNIATTYNQFRFEPTGRNHCQVCRGTTCHVQGSVSALHTLARTLNLQPGHTTPDGEWSLEVSGCIGACGLAPVISVNGEFHGNVTPDSVPRIVQHYNRSRAARPTV